MRINQGRFLLDPLFLRRKGSIQGSSELFDIGRLVSAEFDASNVWVPFRYLLVVMN
ncbi:protein of unknown function [Vibrio tapetis subsp. tapetis]|uniref:Uncharacterized protein n=1 Tax=Vibrio tapetis subsp. tapetis TaxID=1671868 RepID=A0A2N8ZCV8_9VIBR|nr:protein of unknown function [Vibrio tapetis subsp. tapetis]